MEIYCNSVFGKPVHSQTHTLMPQICVMLQGRYLVCSQGVHLSSKDRNATELLSGELCNRLRLKVIDNIAITLFLSIIRL